MTPAADVTAENDAQQQRREIIRVLSRGKSLTALIADPNQLDLRQACRVTKIALEEDADFDKKLVEQVKSGDASSPDQVVRILMVLEAVCAPPRMLGHVLGLKHLEGRSAFEADSDRRAFNARSSLVAAAIAG